MARVSGKRNSGPTQLDLPFDARAQQAPPESAAQPLPVPNRTGLRVIQGGGQKRQEPLASRDAVVRVLVEAGADLLLRRISPERAEEIERRVDRVLHLFDKVDESPILMSVLKRQLDDLEALMRETRDLRTARR